MGLMNSIRRVGRRLDQAITLGVVAMYPIVFSLPAPDPPPDWKRAVKIGWKILRVTVTEAARRFPSLGGKNETSRIAAGDKGLPLVWTPAERIRVASLLLGVIQGDIPAGRYSEAGRPNITSVLHVLHESPSVLNEPQIKASLVRILAETERHS